jgi:hypothetical protein
VSLTATTTVTVSVYSELTIPQGTFVLTLTGTYGSGNPSTGGLTHTALALITVPKIRF